MIIRYETNGNTKGTPEFQPPSPTRLSWQLEPCIHKIEEARLDANKLINVSIILVFLHFIKLSIFTSTGYRFKNSGTQSIWKRFHEEMSLITRCLHTNGPTISLLP